ncbi:MAG: LCP family protein [Candidatus Portnoybacteria bacterium]
MSKKKSFLIILSIILLAFIFYQFIPSSSIEVGPQENQPSEKKVVFKPLPLANQSEEPFQKNILILGRPGEGYSGSNLTDTILLAHLSQTQDDKKALLLSLPRDLLVKVPNRETLTKINALYSLTGVDGLEKKLMEITGLSIDRHLIIDLAVFKEIIDLTDGLNVYVKEDIHDPFFPGPNYSQQTFDLSSGWRYLDGETALKYVRTRYTSPNGDFDRMARQQQVIQLLKQKVLALNPLWDFPTYLKIFNSLNEHIETDLSIFEMKSFYQFAKEIGPDQIKSSVIDKKETGLLTGSGVMLGQQMASVVYPIAGQENYGEIKKYINNLINK